MVSQDGALVLKFQVLRPVPLAELENHDGGGSTKRPALLDFANVVGTHYIAVPTTEVTN